MVTHGDNKSVPIVCACGNTYKYRQGLSRHKKSCSNLINNVIIDTIQPHQQLDQLPKVSSEDMQMTLILELVKQNQDFKDLLIQQSSQMMEQSNQMMEQNNTILEVAKNSQVNNINNNTISHSNNNNKTFNLNFFLNETCKDAMNMKDFIKSLEMSFSELEKMGEVGFAEGMSRLFVDRLNKLDITKRPIHCSASREKSFISKTITSGNATMPTWIDCERLSNSLPSKTFYAWMTGKRQMQVALNTTAAKMGNI